MSERALKVASDGGRGKNGKFVKRGRNNERKGNGAKKNGGFRGKCFTCDRVGHMKRDCPNKVDGIDDGAVFAVSEISPLNESVDSVITSVMAEIALDVGKDRSLSWLINSGATSHMTPDRDDLFEYEVVNTNIEVTIADVVTRDALRVLEDKVLEIGALLRYAEVAYGCADAQYDLNNVVRRLPRLADYRSVSERLLAVERANALLQATVERLTPLK
ncbi:FOG: Transposon-encoded proteins with TYA, reverse transcriptase, integrase domains in various combinations [Plasmopara halstedii]|uniref:FOG: Transposon-encoded proteins with TYA, reverse transcriptase, integrase domains in various combinations n=1 Tax=Plasmopara halstedii TaxID=4781 RepID=A0A0P1ABW4_PLAHL|nr:FOG: Transposon-encoded proteins with TYA, reverse transcriptase, integrase domains in various combinations [Plasmopara halstedii]CEG38249.1 FOG: Transposon-encoded proteins with TYA, reverse transcriptase, integrase domains in various combinations [Plasmopara halstedii]|eukprot:XP_024574618.1 FOG: Transposon-encoded proteins with TYA, reverse transcriptase, integrase domains in various combinations [Plasmopara halstedii]